jgi:hypothetical protein
MWATAVIVIVLCLFTFDALACTYILWSIQRFLQQTSRLETIDDLKAYYAVVSRCMRATLLFVVCMMSALLLTATALATRVVRDVDLVPAVGVALMRVLVLGLVTAWQERRLKEIAAAGPELKLARDEIVQRWEGDVWPRPGSKPIHTSIRTELKL